MKTLKHKISFLAMMLGLTPGFAQDYVVHFDGTNDYIDVGTSSGNGVRTVELWFKPDLDLTSSTVNDYIALIARNDNTEDKEWGLYFSSLAGHDGQLVFFCRQSGTLYEVYSNSSSWSANTWYHVAGVIDASSGMKMYVNCTQQTSTAANGSATQTDNTNYTAIGRWGNYNGRYFDGCIDNVRLWSNALTANNLCDKCGGPAYTTGLLADWRMDDGTGTTATDNSGNGYNGTLTNGPTWELGSACPWVLEFDGSNDYVDLGDAVGDGIRTVEMWFKPDVTINSSVSDYIALIVRDDNTQDKEFGLYFSNLGGNAGKLGFFCRQSGTLYEIFSNSNSWTAGTWYHVAGVIDGSTGMKMYIDGSVQTQTNAQTSATMAATEITALGRWGDENIRYFDGRMENVRLWSVARSSSDISTYKCSETGGSATGLVAYWKFNEGGGSTIYDETANNYDKTTSGPIWVNDGPCGWYPRLENPNPTQPAVATSTAEAPFDFILSPNPASDYLSFQTNSPAAVKVEIFDLAGKKLLETYDMRIDMKNLARGVYFARLTDHLGISIAKKFIRE